MSGGDVLLRACTLAWGLLDPSGGDVVAGGRSRVRGGILGCRPGAARPFSVPQWTEGARLGMPSRMGPLSRGDVGAGPPCVRVASIAGRPPARGGSGVPQWGGPPLPGKRPGAWLQDTRPVGEATGRQYYARRYPENRACPGCRPGSHRATRTSLSSGRCDGESSGWVSLEGESLP